MPDRLFRIWLAVLTVFVVFQVPLMTEKLTMACRVAAEALSAAQQQDRELDALRNQLRNRTNPFLPTSFEQLSGPR